MQSPQDETPTQVFLTPVVGFFQNKTTQNTLAMLSRKFLWEKKKKTTQLSDVLCEFVIFLKLGVLW